MTRTINNYIYKAFMEYLVPYTSFFTYSIIYQQEIYSSCLDDIWKKIVRNLLLQNINNKLLYYVPS